MMSQFKLPAAAQTAAINRVSPPQPGDTLRVCQSELNASLCTLSSLATSPVTSYRCLRTAVLWKEPHLVQRPAAAPPAAAAARSSTGVCRSSRGRSAAASAARCKWHRQQQLHAGQVHGERLGACTGQPSAAVCHVSCLCNGLVHGFRSNASEQPSYQSMHECMTSA
jgi:hypothetical protein